LRGEASVADIVRVFGMTAALAAAAFLLLRSKQ
jgi:hypothetical protein